MSIAIERLKRAMADLPTGGMQTGDYKVKLKLADAQRAIAELEGLLAERDALALQLETAQEDARQQRDMKAKAREQRDALAASIAALHRLHSDLTNAAMVLDDGEHSGYLITNEQIDEMEHLLNEPQQCLAEIRAEAVDDVWKKLQHRWKSDTYGDSAFVRVSEIKEMANAIRQGAE